MFSHVKKKYMHFIICNDRKQIYSIKTKHLNFIISITLPHTHILHLTLQLSF